MAYSDVIRLGMLLLLVWFSGCRGENTTETHSTQTLPAIDVKLTIDYGSLAAAKSLAASVPGQSTVLELMEMLQRRGDLAFAYRGSGAQAFLLSIDGVDNGGAGADNWIFRIDEKLGNASFGAVRLHDGARVAWTLGEYQPE